MGKTKKESTIEKETRKRQRKGNRAKRAAAR